MKKYKYETSFTYEGIRYRIRADTKKDLILKEYKKREELENGAKRIEKNMLLRDWAEEWLHTYKEPAVSAETLYVYSSVVKKYVSQPIGHLQLKQIKPIHLQKIVNNMRGMSRSRIKWVMLTFRQIFDTAVKNGLLLDNPADSLSYPQCTTSIRRSLTDQERHALFRVCSGGHYTAPWILTLLYTGIRPAESIALQIRNVDFKTGMLSVDSAYKRITRDVGTTKTSAGRRKIPLTAPLIDVLKEYCNGRKSPFEPLFKSKTGKPLNDRSARTLWEDFLLALNEELGGKNQNGKMMIRAVADDLVPYCLRHTFCTDLQAADVPINVARELMGHADISITAKIYTHHSPDSIENARSKMNRFNDIVSQKIHKKSQ